MPSTPETTHRFAVTWDYRCPFARNAHEHVVAGLRDGAPWEVTWVPFSLGQVHVAEGEPDIWDRPDDDTGLLALQAGVAVRDAHPERFLDAHVELFAARHDRGERLNEEPAVRGALERAGLDADEVLGIVVGGGPLATIRAEHTAAVADHKVWGVPTFVVGEEAVFVRLMDRPGDDGKLARRRVEGVVDLMGGWIELNEFKHTSVRR